MYDLPMNHKKYLKEYRRFRKNLLNLGFNMIQESVYSKICINRDSLNSSVKALKMQLPKYGNVRILSVTEKQYNSIEIAVGSKSKQEKMYDDRRLIEI